MQIKEFMYLEYRLKPWTSDAIVYRKDITGMDQDELRTLASSLAHPFPVETHTRCVITETGRFTPLPDINA